MRVVSGRDSEPIWCARTADVVNLSARVPMPENRVLKITLAIFPYKRMDKIITLVSGRNLKAIWCARTAEDEKQ